MSDILAPLTIDFLAWLASEPRDYADVMDAWRTSCPRLTIWEDAIDAGFVTRVHVRGHPVRIALTPRGEARLAGHRPLVPASPIPAPIPAPIVAPIPASERDGAGAALCV